MIQRKAVDSTAIDLAPDERGFWVSISAPRPFSIEFDYFAIGVGGHQQQGELTLISPRGLSRHFIPLHFTAMQIGITALRLTAALQPTKQSGQPQPIAFPTSKHKRQVTPSRAFEIGPYVKMVIPRSLLVAEARSPKAKASRRADRYGFGPYRPGPYGFTPYIFSPYGFTPYGFGPYRFGPYGIRREGKLSSRPSTITPQKRERSKRAASKAPNKPRKR